MKWSSEPLSAVDIPVTLNELATIGESSRLGLFVASSKLPALMPSSSWCSWLGFFLVQIAVLEIVKSMEKTYNLLGRKWLILHH